MTRKPKFKSDAFKAIHSAAQGLHRVGTISKATKRDFDVHGAEMGGRNQAAERHGVEVAGRDRKVRA